MIIKSLKIILLLGIMLLIWGLWIGDKAEHAIQGQNFAKESVMAQGTVVQVAHCLNGKSYGEYPLVQFSNATGNAYLAWDQSSCHDFTKGEKVTVRYLSGTPTIIMTQNNIDANWFDLWLAVVVIAVCTLPVAFVVGLIVLLGGSTKRKKKAADS